MPVKGHIAFDPATYWNAKARRSGGDLFKAVAMDDPLENRCIDRIQKSLIPKAISRFVAPSQKPGDQVLDFGCGTGRWYEYLTGLGLRYSGIDISREIVVLAQNKYPTASIRQFDGVHVGQPDSTFSLIVSVGVIHHNQYDKQAAILGELVRVIKPGGYLVLFEGIGPASPEGSVEYPRPLGSWHESVTALGFEHLQSQKARYWILRSAWYDFAARRMTKVGLNRRIFTRLALRCDVVLDPYLCPLLPDWFVTRALMVFRKK